MTFTAEMTAAADVYQQEQLKLRGSHTVSDYVNGDLIGHDFEQGTQAALKSQLVREMRDALKHCDAALTIAFDDYGDGYYNNVNEHVQKALAAYEKEVSL